MKRLNFWHRLGIVASVLWMLGAGLYSLESTTDQAMKFAQASNNLCHEINNPNVNCSDEFITDLHSYDDMIWPQAAIVALLPIPLVWLLAYIAVWTSRWVLAGRKEKTPNSK